MNLPINTAIQLGSRGVSISSKSQEDQMNRVKMIYDQKMLGADSKSDECVMHMSDNERDARQLPPVE